MWHKTLLGWISGNWIQNSCTRIGCWCDCQWGNLCWRSSRGSGELGCTPSLIMPWHFSYNCFKSVLTFCMGGFCWCASFRSISVTTDSPCWSKWLPSRQNKGLLASTVSLCSDILGEEWELLKNISALYGIRFVSAAFKSPAIRIQVEAFQDYVPIFTLSVTVAFAGAVPLPICRRWSYVRCHQRPVGTQAWGVRERSVQCAGTWRTIAHCGLWSGWA